MVSCNAKFDYVCVRYEMVALNNKCINKLFLATGNSGYGGFGSHNGFGGYGGRGFGGYGIIESLSC